MYPDRRQPSEASIRKTAGKRRRWSRSPMQRCMSPRSAISKTLLFGPISRGCLGRCRQFFSSRSRVPTLRTRQFEQELMQSDFRDANESLILTALGAQDLLAAADEARRRQTQLLAMAANELSDFDTPIRLAASTFGISR